MRWIYFSYIPIHHITLYLTFKYESDNMTLISSVRRIILQKPAQHLLALNL